MPDTRAVTYGQLLAENIRLEARVKELEANLAILLPLEQVMAYTGEYALRGRVKELEAAIVLLASGSRSIPIRLWDVIDAVRDRMSIEEALAQAEKGRR